MLDASNTDRPARRTALIAQELRRYNVDIAALAETRLPDDGSLTEAGGGYTFFWKGLPNGEAYPWHWFCCAEQLVRSFEGISHWYLGQTHESETASGQQLLRKHFQLLCSHLGWL